MADIVSCSLFTLNERVDILRQRTTDHDVKKYCIQQTIELGSKEYTRERLVQLEKK